MTLDVNGFLDDDIQTWIEKHRTENQALFDTCHEINRIGQTHLFRLNIHSGDIQDVLLALLLVRALSSFQGSLLLIERGMLYEAKVLLRTHIELLFRIKAVADEPEIATAYVLEDEIHRRRFINKFKKLQDSISDEDGGMGLDALLEGIDQSIKDNEIKPLQAQWFAHKAELNDLYNSAYSVFSSSVHANVRDLQECVVTDDEGNITEFLYGPDVGNLAPLLLTGGETMILILVSISKVFDLSLDDRLGELHEELRQQFSG